MEKVRFEDTGPFKKFVLFKLFLKSVAILCGMQDLSSPTRDGTHAPCSGSIDLLDCQGSPGLFFLKSVSFKHLHAWGFMHFRKDSSVTIKGWGDPRPRGGSGPIMSQGLWTSQTRGACPLPGR